MLDWRDHGKMELPSYQEATLDRAGSIKLQIFEKQPYFSNSWYFTNMRGELVHKYSTSTLSSPASLKDPRDQRLAEVRRRKWNSLSTYSILLRNCKADIKLSCSLLVFDNYSLEINHQKQLWCLSWVPTHSLETKVCTWQLILRSNNAILASFARNSMPSNHVGQLEIATDTFGLESLGHYFPRLVILSLAYIAHTTELQYLI